MSQFKFSRRNTLIGLGGVVALGSGWAVTHDERSMILQMLKLDLPGVSLPHSTLTAFTHHVMMQKKIRESAAYRVVLRALSGVVGIVGYDRLMKVGPGSGVLERFRRSVITEFMMTTDYLALSEPRTDPVSFVGEQLCGNPFARFD